jgi:hypothetical protein
MCHSYGEADHLSKDSEKFSMCVLCVQMSWALSAQNMEQVQQLRVALQLPGMLQAEVEEQAYALVLQQVRHVSNLQSTASSDHWQQCNLPGTASNHPTLKWLPSNQRLKTYLCVCRNVLPLQDIQKYNKQLSASTIKHAATRTYKDKRRALLIKALHTSADVKQGQQHLEGYMTQTLQKELIDKVRGVCSCTCCCCCCRMAEMGNNCQLIGVCLLV